MSTLSQSGKSDKYRLTEEGKKYLHDGLPEENLVKIIKKPIPITEARKKIKNFNLKC